MGLPSGKAVQFTVSDVESLTPWNVAVIVVEPTPLPVANPPPLIPLLIVATPDDDELQCAVFVRSCVLPSE